MCVTTDISIERQKKAPVWEMDQFPSHHEEREQGVKDGGEKRSEREGILTGGPFFIISFFPARPIV